MRKISLKSNWSGTLQKHVKWPQNKTDKMQQDKTEKEAAAQVVSLARSVQKKTQKQKHAGKKAKKAKENDRGRADARQMAKAHVLEPKKQQKQHTVRALCIMLMRLMSAML